MIMLVNGTRASPPPAFDRGIKVSDEAFKYLAVHRGSLDHLKANRRAWHRAYLEGLRSSYETMLPALPSFCSSILDVGAGLGGIDIYLYRHYVVSSLHEPLVTLLDGEDDDPVMLLHRKTFGDREVAQQFQRDNGVPADYVSPEHLFPLNIPADLVVSTGAWCFHFPPDEYLDWVLKNISYDAVLILDVRTDKPEWHADLESVLTAGPVLFQDKKRTRRVFINE